MKRQYKLLTADLKACHGGSFQYVLGEWTPRIENAVACSRGYHTVDRGHIFDWLDRSDMVLVEMRVRGCTQGDGKNVSESVMPVRIVGTLDHRTLRLFAADAAESVLHLFERDYPNDDRPRRAIEAARAFADGEIGERELAAARSAAGAAAGAARDAASAAARDAASAAAWNAAGAAAGAARDAARSAAGAAAGAARDAASAAARDAASAAARDAASAAARDAAKSAASAAHRDMLGKMLIDRLEGRMS